MPDTTILKNEVELIKHLLTNITTPWRLCYRASSHGWSTQQFHAYCDNKTSTVVLIKVGNWIFGGYTDQSWQGKDLYTTGDYKVKLIFHGCSKNWWCKDLT